LKVYFPTAVHADEATFDIQFGNVKRKIHTNTSWDWARFESCGQKWADFSEGHYGVSLLNDGKYGHSAKDGVLCLTLVKSGIEPNPECDQGEHRFTYSLYPHAGDWRCGTIPEAYCLNQPAHALRGGKAGGCFSLADTADQNVMLETIKRAEDGDGWIARVYETDNARTKSALYWNRPVASVEECNGLEEKQADVPFTGLETGGAEIPFVIKPYQIKTFRIREK
ncbi:MAG: alpha-mannosidase, partial [Clostridia bacterium]|nr:alpha-mannosidase [Clostridia bacterium]